MIAGWIVVLLGASVVWGLSIRIVAGVLPGRGDWGGYAFTLLLALLAVLAASVVMGGVAERTGVRGALSWVPGLVMILNSGLPVQVGIANGGFGLGGWVGLTALALACLCVRVGVCIGMTTAARGAARLDATSGCFEPPVCSPKPRLPNWIRTSRRPTLIFLVLGLGMVVAALLPVLTLWQEPMIGVGPLPSGRYVGSGDRYLYYSHARDGGFRIEVDYVGDWPSFQYAVHPTPSTVWKLDGKRVGRDEFVKAVTAWESVDNGTYTEYAAAWFDVGEDGELIEVNETASEAVTVRTDGDETHSDSRPLP